MVANENMLCVRHNFVCQGTHKAFYNTRSFASALSWHVPGCHLTSRTCFAANTASASQERDAQAYVLAIIAAKLQEMLRDLIRDLPCQSKQNDRRYNKGARTLLLQVSEALNFSRSQHAVQSRVKSNMSQNHRKRSKHVLGLPWAHSAPEKPGSPEALDASTGKLQRQ